MTRVGDYDLDRQIGSGATGTVWTAHQRGPISRVVALKRLRAGGSDADLARIRREALVLTELDHPHVVRVLGVVEDGDGVALVMQYAPGGSLRDLLAERGKLTPGEVVAVAAPLAEALASAHRRGVLHGDVTPANVLFTSDGEPLLTDFGVARSLGQHTSDMVAGTAGYVDPELLEGARPDPRADIYSLGVVCYHALTGRPPYTGPGILAVARAADAGDHAPVAEAVGVPPALARVVEQAMARRPDRRFATAGDFARALRTTVPAGEARLPGPAAAPGAGSGANGRGGDQRDGDGPTHTFGPRPPRRAPAARRRRSWRRPVVLAAVVLALAGVVAAVQGRGDDSGGGDDGEAACPAAPVPVPAPGGQTVTGDVTGDGCTVTGTYQSERLPGGGTAMVLTIRLGGAEQRIGLGTAGDQVVLGDWNCDGVDTPALYRAGDGTVEYHDVWPAVEEQSYEPTATDDVATGGEASLEPGEGGDGAGSVACDRVEVAPRSSDEAASAIM
jgi:tRNA A-37 threonylcarbamoyl transferase component Bud32